MSSSIKTLFSRQTIAAKSRDQRLPAVEPGRNDPVINVTFPCVWVLEYSQKLSKFKMRIDPDHALQSRRVGLPWCRPFA